MPLTNVLSVEIRPDSVRRYEERIQKLVQKARQKKDPFTWTAHMTAFGRGPAIHFVSVTEDFAGLQKRGQTPEMLARVLGEKESGSWLEEVGKATQAQEITIATDRPDLSYVREEGRPQDHPLAVVTDLRIRPGLREAFEELIRKLAEAIPKVDDPTQLLTSEVIVGDATRYYTVRPLSALSDLDKQRPPERLLHDAFGASEGGLIFRGGAEAILEIRREVLLYREDLSNPE